ncbi:MAG TPA: hypothetical protein VFU43_01700 [Streptosporangiaceae bacterium]|nr:hypothetical protein [Streptosporangiaceae bacterium]
MSGPGGPVCLQRQLRHGHRPSGKPPAGSYATPPTSNPTNNATLDTLCAACPQLAALRVRVREFAEMMTHRRGRKLEAWNTMALLPVLIREEQNIRVALEDILAQARVRADSLHL